MAILLQEGEAELARLAVAVADAARSAGAYSSGGVPVVASLAQISEAIDLERIALPKEAGRLCGESFMDPSSIISPDETIPRIGICACHKVLADESRFCSCASESAHGILAEEDELP